MLRDSMGQGLRDCVAVTLPLNVQDLRWKDLMAGGAE